MTHLKRKIYGENGWKHEGGVAAAIAHSLTASTDSYRLTRAEQQVHNELVRDIIRANEFFANQAVQNVIEAMAAPCESQSDYRQRAETILKSREAVLGKLPDTAIQINNNGNGSTVTAITRRVIDALSSDDDDDVIDA